MAQENPRKFSLAGILGRKKSTELPELDDFAQSNSTVGLYGKSLHRYTHDALPKMENYKDVMSFRNGERPTLDELHDEYTRKKSLAQLRDEEPINEVKFGWVVGVLVRCLLNIWGVILFLRLSWMVAHAGIAQSIVIIVISTIVTTITTLSMAAVSTNGEIKGGGLYYMISRSLGPGWGGSVGVVFSFANAGMAALNIVGFSEAVIALLKSHGIKILDGAQNDNRIISIITIIILQSIIVIGMEWEAKAQLFLLVTLLVAMADFMVGAVLGPKNSEDIAKGWVGLNWTIFMENMGPGYRMSDGVQQDFFSIFSIFFPAVAGIQAGASISGDLKNPGEAIPKGTLLAIFITSGSYALFAMLAGAGELREASGKVAEIHSGQYSNCTGRECPWGLYNDYEVMQLMSSFGPLIYAGCFAATLSSALSCMVSGPKTFQALCKDKVYPYLSRFGVGYGKTDDPYWSFALGFIIAVAFILIADLDAIAPLISNMMMAAYALLNFCAFHANLLKPVSWRPSFKYFNTWVSLFGSFACVVIMFLMSWQTAAIAILSTAMLYAAVLYRKPDLSWGTSTQQQTYTSALNAVTELSEMRDHVKNYRPQILCLTGRPRFRPALVDLANLITRHQSLLICGNIVQERQSTKLRKSVVDKGNSWLHEHHVKAFYVVVDNCSLDNGTQVMLQASGIGKMAPNIVLLGYKRNWFNCPKSELRDYFITIHQCLASSMSIAVLHLKDGLDCSHLFKDENEGVLDQDVEVDPTLPAPDNSKGAEEEVNKKTKAKKNKKKGSGGADGDGSSSIPAEMSMFQEKQGKGVIDVWWLYDDGGLTLLLPYIISQRKNWNQCKLRVFALANRKDEMEQEMKGMAILLSKFRIDYSDLTIIPDITKRIDSQAESRLMFENLIMNFRGEPDESDMPETVVGESEIYAMKEKTNRHLRLRELLLEHSSKSSLVVMTLPVPRKGNVSAPLYMAWLELLTRDMPPFLLVRGNQTSVLTFYS